jgi:ferric-dicitrate binding protein FerR (iron transport regulator)
MKDEKIWELIVLKLSGEATPDQEAELEEALKQRPDLAFQAGMLEGVWNSRQDREQPDTADRFNRHLQRLSNHLSDGTLKYDTEARSTRRTFSRRGILAVAIAACLGLGIIIVLLTARKEKAPLAVTQNQVWTKKGSRSKLTLPDGTEVWLNASSKVTYGNDFNSDTRKVTLEGEAFFEVTKRNGIPFIIHTDMIDIKVLGTALNVRAYADEKITETALIRGTVEIVLQRNPEKKIILRPDEKLVVRNDTATLTRPEPILMLTQVHYLDKAQHNPPAEALWMKNKLVFDDETLQQIALKLERWYDVKVIIQDKQLEDVQYSGIFENEDISEVLYALQLTGNFHYTIRKKVVTIGL